MSGQSADRLVDPESAAEILAHLADLMAGFRDSDLALQKALSEMTSRSEGATAINELQHIDLMTQVHADLAKMLPVLAGGLRGQPTSIQELRAALTLRSLQDALIDPGLASRPPAAGELSLF